MKFGVNVLIWTANFTPQHLPLLPEIKRQGFDGIEVPLFSPADFCASDIRRGVEQNALECTACSVIPRGLSIGSDDHSVRQKARTHIEDCVKLAAHAGAKILAGPLYTPVGYLPGRRRTADEWKWAVESYQSLGPVLERYGVTLAIEPLNRFETYFLNTAADAAALCDQIGHANVGILFDTFHANIEEKSIPNAIRSLGKGMLGHFHACENDRGIPGSGHQDWNGIRDALREVEYDGAVVIESFTPGAVEIAKAASIWRPLAPSQDELASEGARFLRGLLG